MLQKIITIDVAHAYKTEIFALVFKHYTANSPVVNILLTCIHVMVNVANCNLKKLSVMGLK